MKRILIYAGIIIFGLLIWRLRSAPVTQVHPPPVTPPMLIAEGFQIGPNSLRLLQESTITNEVAVPLNEPAEFDGLNRREWVRLRSAAVQAFPDLLAGEYRPMIALFGGIVDQKPWWGIKGQFCHGHGGEKSILGAAEESRYVLNPYLLLGLDQNKAFISQDYNCHPVYPRPVELRWQPAQARAEVTYDLKRFFKDKRRYPARGNGEENTFGLTNYNARDFGYNYIYVDAQQSTGVAPLHAPSFFEYPMKLRNFLHLGRSCRHPEGCNNGSPYEPGLEFYVQELPAKLTCHLWKDQPTSREDPSDLIFTLHFQ